MKKLILSLDNVSFNNTKQMLRIIDENFDENPLFGIKIKPSFLMEYGLSKIRVLKSTFNLKIMLDHKLFDTADVMEDQLKFYVNEGVDLVTAHITSLFTPKDKSLLDHLVGVTLLTTYGEDYTDTMYGLDLGSTINRFFVTAQDLGYTNLVCAARDLEIISAPFSEINKFTPAIRPLWYQKIDDQKRKTTPKEAMLAGSDVLIMGRPLLQFVNEPEKFIEAIKKTVAEIEGV